MFTSNTETLLRFLLPCTTQADPEAIDAAIEIAHSYGATLVTLSLQDVLEIQEEGTPQPTSPHEFRAFIQHRTETMKVPLEWFNLSTHNTDYSIHLFAEEMDCSGILLFVCEGKGIMLKTTEVQYVLKHAHLTLPFLIDLIPAPKTPFPLSWIARHLPGRVAPHNKKAFPLWYPFALLVLSLIVATLIFVNGLDLLAQPVFSLASLLAKFVFICVVAFSLSGLLMFCVDKWRQK